jgi:hypothetical protein
MRTWLWAVMVLVIEVLRVWGYIALVDGRRIFSKAKASRSTSPTASGC